MVILTSLPQKSPNLFMTTQYNDYYTYAYLREDKTPYYIGKGRGNRAYDKRRTIKPPKDKSLILLLKKGLTEAEAFKHEVYMIFVLGRKDLGTGILRNRTDGGEGPSGAVRSAEAKKRYSESKTGEKNPQYGVPRTEESKKKQSVTNTGKTRTEAQKQAMSGENNPMFNVSHTEESKKKISLANSGENHPHYGRTGALHPGSKAIIVIEPDGTQQHFGSIREAARDLVIPNSSLYYYLESGQVLKRGKFKGWQFLFKNSENF